MQEASHNVESVIKAVTGDFTDVEVLELYGRLPSVMSATGVRKVHFYRLWCRGQWVNAPDRVWLTDHTDRFYEVIDKLAEFLVESMNYCQIDPKSVPSDIFVVDDNNINGIKRKYMSYQDLFNMFKMYLPSNQYWFGIDEFDIDY